jgi:molecular chaperone GrpE
MIFIATIGNDMRAKGENMANANKRPRPKKIPIRPVNKSANSDSEEPQEPVERAEDRGEDTSAADVESANTVPETAAEGNAQSNMEHVQEELATVLAEHEELLDKYKRSLADFANYRKRQDRDREMQAMRMRMEVLRDLLPIIDDFHLALDNAPRSPEESEWVAGVQLIERKLIALLRAFGAETMEALGKPFDPNYHDALLYEPSDEYPEGTVSQVIRQGYIMGDEVLRPAMVNVSRGPDSDQPSQT